MRWLLLCLLSVLLIGFVIAAPHSVDSRFSQAEGRLSLSGSSLSVVDDAVYKIGYYAHDGDSVWTPFVLDGSVLGGDWLHSGTYTLPDFGVGEHYVVVYSCTASGSAWSCHDGRWQLHVISNIGSSVGGFVASYDFESSAGGTLENGATLVQDSLRGSVLSPNGGVFRVPDNSAPVIVGVFSLSAWVWLDSSDDVSKIVVKPTDGIVDPFELYALDVRDGDVRLVLTDGVPYAVGDWAVASAPISLHQWHHILGTYDGDTMRLYLDGVLVDSVTFLGDFTESGEDLLIGSYVEDYSLNGLIDDVSLYDYALSEDEVVALYGGVIPVVCSGSAPTRPCSIENGVGEQSGICVEGEWTDWNTCTLVSCADGYHTTGNTCVANDGDPITLDTNICLNCDTGACSCTADEECSPQGVCLLDVSGETFFVAPDGSDSNPGTYNNPWATWGKAFDEVGPGDIAYLRGGIYYHTVIDGSGYTLSKRGTSGDIIRIFNYPGEQPTLDCSTLQQTGHAYALKTEPADNVHFKGLEIQNLQQRFYGNTVTGWIASGTNTIIENCKIHDIGGGGLWLNYEHNFRVINCDGYNMVDPLWTHPGEQGTAFGSANPYDSDTSAYFINCRAWNNSDQGFSAGSNGLVVFDGCWSMDNGRLTAGGWGFKLGFVREASIPLQRVVKNNIAVNNRRGGFTTNEDNEGYPAQNMHIYNNFAYHNGYDSHGGYGYYIYKPYGGENEQLKRVFRNNLAYENEQGDVLNPFNSAYTHSHNSWDTSVVVSASDFMSLDTDHLYRPRKADGSLPDITFGKLVEGSDLIDKGVDVGLPYSGVAPDLGPFEYQG